MRQGFIWVIVWTKGAVEINIGPMEMYPLKFEPIFKRRIWGGRKLQDVFGKDIPAGERIGESWELADLPDDKSVIANGELAGQTIREAIEKWPEEITGEVNFSLPFPLLIKILDCEEVLSIQVHPDAEAVGQMGKGDMKTECWYVIWAAQNAVIYKGLKDGVKKEDFLRAIENGTVEQTLRKIEVKQGECHILPAGTTHAIGAGLLMAEIQTPSDTTYRVFDWNRLDDGGKPRQLHIEEALQCIHFDSSADDLSVTTVGRLVDCEYFKIDKGHQASGCELLLSPGKMKTLIILTGFGTILGRNGEATNFRAGETILVPAVYMGAMTFADESEYLTVTI